MSADVFFSRDFRAVLDVIMRPLLARPWQSSEGTNAQFCPALKWFEN